MNSYDTHIKRVLDVKDGWALVEFTDRRQRYLNTNRIDPLLVEKYEQEKRDESTQSL